MRVLVTGGAGFIGSHLVEVLLERGDDCLVLDNYATGRRDNLQAHERLEVVEGTIADEDVVERCFRDFRPDAVAHAAASYKDPDAWNEDVRTNVLGSAIVARACVGHGVGRVVYFQTALCYGLQPFEQPITLDHPIRPSGSSYAFSKTAGEQYIDLSGIDYVSLRLANAYGPRNISGPLPTFFRRLTEGKPCFVMDTRRDFIYVTDVVDVAVRALDGQGRRGPYHVSSGSDLAIKELFDATVDALGIQLEQDVEVRERHPDDAPTILLDPTRTHEDFEGWEANHSLTSGVKAAVEYYRKCGIEETFTHLRMGKGDEGTADR